MYFRGRAFTAEVVESPSRPARPSSGGVFFRETLDLGAGPHSVRLNVQFSAFARGDQVSVHARTGEAPATDIASATVRADEEDALIKADSLMLTFELAAPQRVTFEGDVSAHATSTHLRHLSQAPIERLSADNAAFWFHPDAAPPRRPLRFVVIGTTATCNANCTHCPTNKAYTRAQARGVMDMALFERIVRNLDRMGFNGGVCFGLHGEPLQDPLLTQRIDMIRALCPSARIGVSTNAAVYDPDEHLQALGKLDDVSVHIEALTPEVYDVVMRPLKTHRTFPRVESLIAELGDQVRVVSPVHRQNIDQIDALKFYWEDRGAGETELMPMSNRCGQSPNFDALALAPMGVGCDPDMVNDLTVDWDGAVLTCCQDFHRRSIIGDLRLETIEQVMENQQRNRVRELFNQKRWGAIETCVNCRWDDGERLKGLLQDRLSPHDHKRRFDARLFRSRGPVLSEAGQLIVNARNLMGMLGLKRMAPRATLYGPRRRLTPGRYRIRYDIDRLRADIRGSIAMDVTDGDTILARGSAASEGGEWLLDLQIGDDAGPLQFRLHVAAASLKFSGVTAERLA